MGYTTDFLGHLTLTPPATKEQRDYINLISKTRRMKRDVNKLFQIYKGKYGNPFAESDEEIYGNEGEYFAKDDGQSGENHDDSIIDYNVSPGQMGYDQAKVLGFNAFFYGNKRRSENGDCQPGLWCQWVISEDGTRLEWDEGEKFYDYIPWLKYYINHFFKKWGIKLNGRIRFQGEDPGDKGIIEVIDNVVGLGEPKRKITLEDPYGEEEWDDDI